MDGTRAVVASCALLAFGWLAGCVTGATATAGFTLDTDGDYGAMLKGGFVVGSAAGKKDYRNPAEEGDADHIVRLPAVVPPDVGILITGARLRASMLLDVSLGSFTRLPAGGGTGFSVGADGRLLIPLGEDNPDRVRFGMGAHAALLRVLDHWIVSDDCWRVPRYHVIGPSVEAFALFEKERSATPDGESRTRGTGFFMAGVTYEYIRFPASNPGLGDDRCHLE